jgi:hypothetical protein
MRGRGSCVGVISGAVGGHAGGGEWCDLIGTWFRLCHSCCHLGNIDLEQTQMKTQWAAKTSEALEITIHLYSKLDASNQLSQCLLAA